MQIGNLIKPLEIKAEYSYLFQAVQACLVPAWQAIRPYRAIANEPIAHKPKYARNVDENANCT